VDKLISGPCYLETITEISTDKKRDHRFIDDEQIINGKNKRGDGS
jgi:hypothetical protein